MSMAPCVSSGHSENAMFADVSISCIAIADEPREAATAVLGRERHAPPPGVDVLLVRVATSPAAS